MADTFDAHSTCPPMTWARLWLTTALAQVLLGCGKLRNCPMSETLLLDIADYCRRAGMAESTFGRLAVNDGKLVSRLRLGGRVTTDTADRVHAFIARKPRPEVNGQPVAAPLVAASPVIAPGPAEGAARNFRFYDNRQKYLLFVTTCGEKWAI